VEAARLRFEVLVQPREALQLLGDLLTELVHALGIVAPQRAAEVIPPNVEWGEVKGLVDHAGLAPKRTVPRRTKVAPSSTAIS